jgi:uncharacterized membrane-anchored protein
MSDNTTQVEDAVPVDQPVDAVSAGNESNVENVQSEPVQPEVTPEQQPVATNTSAKGKGTSRKKAAKTEVQAEDVAVEVAPKEPVQNARPEILPFTKLGANTDAYSIKANQNIVNQIKASIRRLG